MDSGQTHDRDKVAHLILVSKEIILSLAKANAARGLGMGPYEIELIEAIKAVELERTDHVGTDA